MTNRWIVLALIAFLLAVGLFLVTSDAVAYAGTKPEMCANCHVMDDTYESWYHAGHQPWTTCSDCHTPHALVPKYWVKAQQGAHDVYVFVFKGNPESLHTSLRSRQIIQENCIRCHARTVEPLLAASQPFDRNCWDCHRYVAHQGFGVSPFPRQDSSLYPTTRRK